MLTSLASELLMGYAQNPLTVKFVAMPSGTGNTPTTFSTIRSTSAGSREGGNSKAASSASVSSAHSRSLARRAFLEAGLGDVAGNRAEFDQSVGAGDDHWLPGRGFNSGRVARRGSDRDFQRPRRRADFLS